MKRDAVVELPAEVLRNECYYRSPNPKTGLGEIGCGFFSRLESRPQDTTISAGYFGLIYLLRGSGRIVVNRSRPRLVQPGDVIQVSPGTQLTVIPDRPVNWVEAFVTGDIQWIQRFAKINNLDLEKPVLRIGLDLLLVHQFRQIVTELNNPTQWSLQGTLVRVIELVAAIHQLSRSEVDADKEALLAKACRMLETNLDQRLELESVAAQLGIGYHLFRRLFREHLGVSPGQYRIYWRLQQARLMLLHGHKTIMEVARELGYADQSVFSKQFKKAVGQSPGHFIGK